MEKSVEHLGKKINFLVEKRDDEVSIAKGILFSMRVNWQDGDNYFKPILNDKLQCVFDIDRIERFWKYQSHSECSWADARSATDVENKITNLVESWKSFHDSLKDNTERIESEFDKVKAFLNGFS